MLPATSQGHIKVSGTEAGLPAAEFFLMPACSLFWGALDRATCCNT